MEGVRSLNNISSIWGTKVVFLDLLPYHPLEIQPKIPGPVNVSKSCVMVGFVGGTMSIYIYSIFAYFLYIYLYVYIRIYIYTYIYVYIFIWWVPFRNESMQQNLIICPAHCFWLPGRVWPAVGDLRNRTPGKGNGWNPKFMEVWKMNFFFNWGWF